MSVCRSVLATAALASLVAAPVSSTQSPASFPKTEMMTVGVYYYPEAWPHEQWERDFANIRKHGFEFVHMAEFAWAFMEPQEGRFDFEWLERAVRLAAAQGLKVVLCTPSATPPAWLTRAHPETLMIDARGRRMNHGSREHATWSSPVYRRYVERIVTELARRFGRNPNVWGWQIDNELSHYGRSYSYAPVNQEKFRDWLRGRYRTIDALNTAWGNAFWSQMYNDFSQIDIPNPDELVAAVNEHALLDFQRWFAEEAADYIRFQAGVLRRHTSGHGIETASGDLEQEIVRRVFVEAGVAVEDYPPQLMVDWRDGFWIASSFSSIEHDAPVPPGASLVVGTRRLPPGGVAIWKE